MPLRLAFLSSWILAPEKGSGTAVAISGLAGGLRSLGCRVDLVGTERVLSPRLAGVARPGVLPARLAYNLALPLRFDPAGYDAVVGFDLDGCLLGRFEPGTAPGSHPLQVVSLKGVAADERRFETGFTGGLFTLMAGLEARNTRRADRVVVTSEYCRARATETYGVPPERLRIVPEGIDLEPWERADDRPTPNDPGDRTGPTLLNVARQYRRKDTRTLLAALPAVLRGHPGATLRVVGGGPELPALRRQAAALGVGDRVRFLGETADDEAVRREYRRADLFCLPSRQEGFGIALLEAMAAGTPIVAADAGAIPEVAPDGEAALLVPPGDPAALAAAVRRVLEDGALRRRLRRAGRERVRRYSWPMVARRFLAALGFRDDLGREDLGRGGLEEDAGGHPG
jgi:glycosyltransferase involved in cell wall biosynthesis